MSRPVKYRRNVFIFRLPSNEPIFRQEDRVIMESGHFCKECRKPLSNKQIKAGYKYCSHKCSNRANGRKAKGSKRKPRVDLLSMR